MTHPRHPRHRPLRPGDVVEIRSTDEILATLDADGTLDGMPFMPEMLRFCGQRATVDKRADKTCDTIEYRGQRRLDGTVHLSGLRCTGEDHGGCQARCLLFWREAWLKRPGEPPAVRREPVPVAKGLTADDLRRLARRPRLEGSSLDRYACQATELLRASRFMPWWDPRQYVRDVTSGNVGVLEEIRGIILWLFIRVQKRLINGSKVPFMKGRLERTPKVLLDLQPGEVVRVRSRREIQATLDTDNRNRGLSFDAEMLRYIGQEMRVDRRVERIIDEKTGELTPIRGDCIALEGAFCTSEYHRNCPRAIDIYWREIWLERARGGPDAPAGATAGDGALAAQPASTAAAGVVDDA